MARAIPGVVVMLNTGADPNLRASDGSLPIFRAMLVGDLEIIKLLSTAELMSMLEGNRVILPCMLPLVNGRKDIAEYLLNQGASPDVRNYLGVSPRQISLFNELSRTASESPRSSLDQWLEVFRGQVAEKDLSAFLQLCKTLLDNKTKEGSLSAVKARTLQMKIDEFQEELARPAATAPAIAAKTRRMKQIIDELKSAFAKNLP